MGVLYTSAGPRFRTTGTADRIRGQRTSASGNLRFSAGNHRSDHKIAGITVGNLRIPRTAALAQAAFASIAEVVPHYSIGVDTPADLHAVEQSLKITAEQIMAKRPTISGHRKTKYIFVTGGVVSSLGKGIAAASMGRLLKSCGLRVTMMKLDPYINVDAGTMNPYQHGEVYVTEDGAETDLDLGHYERFIDVDMAV